MSLFKRLLGKKTTSDQNPDENGHSKYFPENDLPIDEKFTRKFSKNGGKFLYCENWEEIEQAFDNILLENDWYEQDVWCMDPSLEEKFQGYNLKFNQTDDPCFVFSRCESLVAANGAILLCSNQIKEKKLNELPANIVIFATTSQLVETISEGLRLIKSKSDKFIPSNITTIQDFESDQEKDFMSYGSSTKNLYLLLLEDL
ncbi:MAG: lactate utilization protein B/C [Flavobacteriaceae bacterium]|jgi:hypothetical protein|nr:lactate utilization protein B/C [Flavobacteriaceae bacterium]MDG1962274.1 lactate utilization protein B/C [Flavobacteriaceae bacterium]